MDRTEPTLTTYRTTLARRDAEERREQERRKKKALHVAQHLASWLKETYTVERVVLFGSVAGEARLGPRSDIDLAVWGLGPARYYEAVACVQEEAAPFTVDLIRIERSPGTLREVIEKEGVEL